MQHTVLVLVEAAFVAPSWPVAPSHVLVEPQLADLQLVL